jgi:Tfp pilus assembly protein PilV
VYCDGERILSAGYDPVAGINYPQLATPGADDAGDMWKVALVTTTLTGTTLHCSVAPTQSTVADTALDGTTAYCVDDATLNGAAAEEYLTSGGGLPASANALCFH